MWQSSVWGQSSVWSGSSDPDGVSAFRIMQSSVWQSSVWKDHVHSGRVWRMQAAAKFPKSTVRATDATDFAQNEDIDVDADSYVTVPMSWKTATLDGLKQVCPPWHLYQITDMSPGLMTGPGTASGETDKKNTCFPDSMQMPEEVRTGVNGLGEDVHIFILDTGVDAYHPDLIGVADPDDAHHYNAVAKEDEDGCDVDLRCMLKYGDKVLVDGVETMVAEEHCASPTVDWYVTRSHPASDSRAHSLRTSLTHVALPAYPSPKQPRPRHARRRPCGGRRLGRCEARHAPLRACGQLQGLRGDGRHRAWAQIRARCVQGSAMAAVG